MKSTTGDPQFLDQEPFFNDSTQCLAPTTDNMCQCVCPSDIMDHIYFMAL